MFPQFTPASRLTRRSARRPPWDDFPRIAALRAFRWPPFGRRRGGVPRQEAGHAHDHARGAFRHARLSGGPWPPSESARRAHGTAGEARGRPPGPRRRAHRRDGCGGRHHAGAVADLARRRTASLEDAKVFARETNAAIGEAVRRHPDRFFGLASLPLLDPPAAIAELERAIARDGCKGLVINGHLRGRYLDDPFFGRRWRAPKRSSCRSTSTLRPRRNRSSTRGTAASRRPWRR